MFFAVLFYCIPFKTAGQQNDSLLVQLARKWSNAKAYTLKMAELMPEPDYDFRPTPEEMSFREQLLHIAQNIQWLSTSYLLADKKAPAIDTTLKSKATVIQILTAAYDIGSEAHEDFDAQQLDKPVQFFAGTMTKRQIFILLHDHQSHHVGQIIVYLRLKGIKPPSYVGW
ncbi:MAG TPA: DinB family protein [Agriterribacter sp.]|nr:DinB family protein [Agriterribacter sp.]